MEGRGARGAGENGARGLVKLDFPCIMSHPVPSVVCQKVCLSIAWLVVGLLADGVDRKYKAWFYVLAFIQEI